MQHSGPMPPSDRPTHRRHLASDGLTPWRLRREHRALFRGVYVSRKALVDIWLLAQAALVTAGPGAFVSHHSAAALWEGAVPDHPDVHITYRKNRARAAGIAAHRLKADQEVVQLRGLPVTTPVQTFLDMSHALSLVDLVVLGDSLVRRGRCTPGQLVDAAERRAGPYSRLARRAARLVRAHVDSPMETRTRLLIVFAGLPEPGTVVPVGAPAPGAVVPLSSRTPSAPAGGARFLLVAALVLGVGVAVGRPAAPLVRHLLKRGASAP